MGDALDIHPHVRNLVANYAIVTAYHAGAEVLVPKGTSMHKVTLSWMMAKRAVMDAGELKVPTQLDEALTRMRQERH